MREGGQPALPVGLPPSRPGSQSGGARHLVQGGFDGADQCGVGPELADDDPRLVLAQASHEAVRQGLLECLGRMSAQKRPDPAEGDDVGVGDIDQPGQAAAQARGRGLNRRAMGGGPSGDDRPNTGRRVVDDATCGTPPGPRRWRRWRRGGRCPARPGG